MRTTRLLTVLAAITLLVVPALHWWDGGFGQGPVNTFGSIDRAGAPDGPRELWDRTHWATGLLIAAGVMALAAALLPERHLFAGRMVAFVLGLAGLIVALRISDGDTFVLRGRGATIYSGPIGRHDGPQILAAVALAALAGTTIADRLRAGPRPG